jgi:hypothetical protein
MKNVLYTFFLSKYRLTIMNVTFFLKVGTTIVAYSAVYVIVDININIGGLAYLTQFINT